MNTFKHYILTRFNLGVYDQDNPYSVKVGTPDRWMKHRIKLFERYCLPSVINQTCQKFTWLMAWHPDTPEKYVEPYRMDNVIICYEQPAEWLRKQQPRAEWLITSRMDNDDMYDERFVEMIQAAFREQEEIIDIDYIVLDQHTGKAYPSGRHKPTSPFLSLVEPWTAKPMTAMGKPHSRMFEFYPARKLGTMATQVIHEKNVCNKIPKQ